MTNRMYYFMDSAEHHPYPEMNGNYMNYTGTNRNIRKSCPACGEDLYTLCDPAQLILFGEPMDYYCFTEECYISEHFLQFLRVHHFTGYQTIPVIVTSADGKKQFHYERLIITGQCGLLCDSDEKIIPHCPVCKVRSYESLKTWHGVSFQTEAHDGSDFVQFVNFNDWNMPIVHESLMKLILSEEFTNFYFEPLADFIFEDM